MILVQRRKASLKQRKSRPQGYLESVADSEKVHVVIPEQRDLVDKIGDTIYSEVEFLLGLIINLHNNIKSVDIFIYRMYDNYV